MIFHSLAFLAFFVGTVALYWALPRRAQNGLLLAASYVFYGWVHPWFVSLIVATSLIVYASAIAIERWPRRRRAILWSGIMANVGLLAVFKYFNFFVENVAAALALAGWRIPLPLLTVALPVGISFYTFQAAGYVIDVYRHEQKARRSFLDVAVFVSFFPTLVAGPIMRARSLLVQVEGERRFPVAGVRDATLLMLWGFFKKLVIADNVGVIANKVFALASPDFYVLWAGVFAFAIQIYADFSACTDIARGAAKWLGFDLMSNFDHPYLATGPTDFWRRWNISLTTWFRDYVFFPLSFVLSRRTSDARWLWLSANARIYVGATLLTFLISGLWHGAGWNFVIWGAYHGVLLAIARVTSKRRSPRRAGFRRLDVVQIPAMFLLTCVGWLVFRESNLAMLLRDLTLNPFQSTRLQHQAGNYLLLLAGLYSVPLWIQSLWARFAPVDLGAAMSHEEGRPRLLRVAAEACLAAALFIGILTLRSTASLDFIYAKF